MKILSNKTNIDFMRLSLPASLLSIVLIIGTIYLWVSTGDSKYGIDFRGGNEFIVKFENDLDIGRLRRVLSEAGFNDAVVQNFSDRADEFSIKVGANSNQDQGQHIREVLTGIEDNNYSVIREDFVGPVIGEQIRRDAILATIFSLIGILAYVTIRFNFAFAMGVVVAILHDALIAVGATILAGKGIGAGTLAAALTILGYSVNDTIVIFDRVRENLAIRARTGSVSKQGASVKLKNMSLSEVLNLSVNETMSRTIITTLTILFVAFTLWYFGGGEVSDLAFTLLVGFAAGTYSTVFIASPVVAFMIGDKGDKPEPVKA